MENNEKWVKQLEHSCSFHFRFIIPVTLKNWQNQILVFDEEFLMISKKYGLLYFKSSIPSDYRKLRTQNFFFGPDRHIVLLDFIRNYTSEHLQFTDRYHLDIPVLVAGKYVNQTESFYNHSSTQKLLELDSLIGAVHLFDIEQLVEYQDINISFTLSSSSNIWFDQIQYTEDNNGNINYSENEKNNRSIAYRITPRLNSFIRDIKSKVEQLGGSAILEDFNRQYVTENGILLDGNIVYQEDIDSGRIDLAEIDN